jgi:hypothetical protein
VGLGNSRGLHTARADLVGSTDIATTTPTAPSEHRFGQHGSHARIARGVQLGQAWGDCPSRGRQQQRGTPLVQGVHRGCVAPPRGTQERPVAHPPGTLRPGRQPPGPRVASTSAGGARCVPGAARRNNTRGCRSEGRIGPRSSDRAPGRWLGPGPLLRSGQASGCGRHSRWAFAPSVGASPARTANRQGQLSARNARGSPLGLGETPPAPVGAGGSTFPGFAPPDVCPPTEI